MLFDKNLYKFSSFLTHFDKILQKNGYMSLGIVE